MVHISLISFLDVLEEHGLPKEYAKEVGFIEDLMSQCFCNAEFLLTLCLPVLSADNLGKQFGPRSGPTNRRA